MKKLNAVFLSVLAAVGLMMSSCDKNDSDVKEPDVAQKGDTRAAVELNNDFAFNLFREYSRTQVDNGAISPLSVFTCLSMLANGDDSDTRDAILKALGYRNGGSDLNLLNNYSKEIADILSNADSGTICTLNNAIWAHSSASVLPHYDAFLKNIYGAESFSFTDPVQGQKDVNNWVSEKTYGVITDFLPNPLNANVILINSSYFKGEWAAKFDEDHTKPRTFYNKDKSESEVYMMYQQNTWNYTETEDYQLANLPYGNGSFEMTLVLPKPDKDIDQVIKKFDNRELTSALEKTHMQNFLLMLPRCKMSTKFDILPNLEKMGVPSPLSLNKVLESQNADFQTILHGTDIEIGEEGTTAAATTAEFSYGSSMSQITPEGLICDRPFFFLIREVSTGTILYIGKVVKLENVE